ncbi:MAG: RNA chaperone Hfq [Gammaproteobacteria bacterium]
MNTVEKQFLNYLISENQPVFIYLVNGVRLDGYLLSFDSTSFVLVSKTEPTNPLLIYRNIVATVQQATLFSRNRFRRTTLSRPSGLKQVTADSLSNEDLLAD